MLLDIAKAAVAVERSYDIPAELVLGQKVVESGWEVPPHCNCFGIKWVADLSKKWHRTPTWELLTPSQLASIPKEDIIQVYALDPNLKKHKVRMYARFAFFDTLEECFAAYVRMLLTRTHFLSDIAAWRKHRNLAQLVKELGEDPKGMVYYTAAGYVQLFNKIINQPNVKAALVAARKEKPSEPTKNK